MERVKERIGGNEVEEREPLKGERGWEISSGTLQSKKYRISMISRILMTYTHMYREIFN